MSSGIDCLKIYSMQDIEPLFLTAERHLRGFIALIPESTERQGFQIGSSPRLPSGFCSPFSGSPKKIICRRNSAFGKPLHSPQRPEEMLVREQEYTANCIHELFLLIHQLEQKHAENFEEFCPEYTIRGLKGAAILLKADFIRNLIRVKKQEVGIHLLDALNLYKQSQTKHEIIRLEMSQKKDLPPCVAHIKKKQLQFLESIAGKVEEANKLYESSLDLFYACEDAWHIYQTQAERLGMCSDHIADQGREEILCSEKHVQAQKAYIDMEEHQDGLDKMAESITALIQIFERNWGPLNLDILQLENIKKRMQELEEITAGVQANGFSMDDFTKMQSVAFAALRRRSFRNLYIPLEEEQFATLLDDIATSLQLALLNAQVQYNSCHLEMTAHKISHEYKDLERKHRHLHHYRKNMRAATHTSESEGFTAKGISEKEETVHTAVESITAHLHLLGDCINEILHYKTTAARLQNLLRDSFTTGSVFQEIVIKKEIEPLSKQLQEIKDHLNKLLSSQTKSLADTICLVSKAQSQCSQLSIRERKRLPHSVYTQQHRALLTDQESPSAVF